jgi:NitT/TauT family transport system substrate-binding protein
MKAAVPLVHTGDDQIGWMRAEIWGDMHDLLLDQELLDEPFNVDDVYTMEFLNEIYKSEP